MVAHDPQAAQRRALARRQQVDELITLRQPWGGRLDAQDPGERRRGRPLSDSGVKARLYHAVKEAHLAHVIKVDLRSALFQFSIDEDRQAYLQRLHSKLILATRTDAPAAEGGKPLEEPAGQRAWLPRAQVEYRDRAGLPLAAHALACLLVLVPHRVPRMRLQASNRPE